MLKHRVITALVLVAVLLAALTVSNPIYWQLLISFVLFIGLWEWLRFCKITELTHQLVFFVLFAVVLAGLQADVVRMPLLIITTCVLWLLMLIFTFNNQFTKLHHPVVKALIGIWLLAAAGHFVIELKSINNGVLWILCMMVAIWVADIGAYFSGKRFGKTKLAPSISPGKTVEGLVGGLFCVLALYVPIMMVNFSFKQAVLLILTILATALISVGGDLFESKLKRHAGLKDSSQILPGHGGILDRIDSLLAGVPFFMLGLLMLDLLN